MYSPVKQSASDTQQRLVISQRANILATVILLQLEGY